MAAVTFAADGIEIGAEAIAAGLGLAPAAVPPLMRNGEITAQCERGVGADAGRHRLTFFHRGRRLRLVVDDSGQIILRSAVDFGDRPMPSSLRRPGG
ncbi:MAG TPA: DUF6522 family protein [Hyphomicrobiales bacterium]|nr:DUF6522 family protein [Hyphomicrobiales bacterium]